MINFSHQPAYGLILPGKRNQCTTVICPSYVAGRKRARLDFLSEEEKAIRRKLLNREAAQKARDRKKDTIRSMEQCIQDLQVENFKLRQTINSLKNKCRDHELKFISLRQEIKAFTEISKCKRRRQIEPIESAVLVLCLLALSYLHLLSRVQVSLRLIVVGMLILSSRTASSQTFLPRLQFRLRKCPKTQPMR
uniref:X-box-binding protein 1 n=1 Tax=Mesocestoides corti TaxID=53468 RepID=A0A5K3FDU0_MESCO